MQKNRFDIYQVPNGHFKRFKEKFDETIFHQNKKSNKLKWYLVAASLALLISLWYNFKPIDNTGYELADVSEQMKETQIYFKAVIDRKLKKAKAQENKKTSQNINNVLTRVRLLENEYANLSIELKNTEFDKRIVSAMIFNFQQRIKILQDLLNQIENIKTTHNESKTNV